jgi:F-type H+-transporting ATPase subunit a
MDITKISTDAIVYWQWGPVVVNATIVYTWAVMLLLTGGSWWITRNLSKHVPISRWQNLLEILMLGVRSHVRSISQQESVRYLPFVATLFLFIGVSNLLNIIPGFYSPAGSLSTTAGLALCVFVAVPLYGIAEQGFAGYLRHYVRPTLFMLPFHVIGELSRTLALAVRLFGNVMSGTKIVLILLAVTPLFFPVLMDALGLLTGLLHAYIFALLATVYIASSSRARDEQQEKESRNSAEEQEEGEKSNG